MSRVWIFLHLLGFTMWLGGGLAAMFASIAAKREDRRGLGSIVRALAAIYRTIIGPGALLTVLSGLMLMLRLSGRATEFAGFSPALLVMQAAGAIGALLALLVALPTASRLARIDPEGPSAAFFDELRTRLRVVGMLNGVLGLVALVSGVFLR